MVAAVVEEKLWISHRARKRPESAFAIKGFHRVCDYPAERPAQLKHRYSIEVNYYDIVSDYPAERPAQLKRPNPLKLRAPIFYRDYPAERPAQLKL